MREGTVVFLYAYNMVLFADDKRGNVLEFENAAGIV